MDIVEEMRVFEVDHEPDGWPAVKMKQVSALCDEIDALRAELQQLREQEQKPDGFIVGNTKYTDPEVAAIFEIDISGGYFVYAAPVPEMPMQSGPLSDEEIRLIREQTSHESGDWHFDTRLYARKIERAVLAKAMPMPKQEPAVAVPDHVIAKTINDLRDVAVKYHGAQQLREQIASIIRPLLKSSPRITEQDAREIIKSFEDFADEDESAYEESAWLTYMAWSGRALLDKLNANTVAEVRKEPFCDCEYKAHDWWRVEVKLYDGTLLAIEPEMLAGKSDLTGRDEETIRTAGRHLLAFIGEPQPAQAEAMPEYLSAIEVLRENIRNPDRGVEYCGIFDNDKTRAAIGTLLSAAPKPEQEAI